MDLHFLIFATFLYKVLPLTRLLEGPFLLHHSYRGEHVQSSCWLHSLYRSASLIFPLRISSKIIHFHSCSFLMFFFSDVSTDYFCCSVEWCVARRKHSHFGLCEGPSDHRGMPMLNSSKLICSPQRQSREKFLKYCPLLQAACWTNRPTKLFWPWDLAWSVKNRQALASFVFQVARNYLMWHYWQVHGEDPRVQCAKKKASEAWSVALFHCHCAKRLFPFYHAVGCLPLIPSYHTDHVPSCCSVSVGPGAEEISQHFQQPLSLPTRPQGHFQSFQGYHGHCRDYRGTLN